MKILVLGAGVLGCTLAMNLFTAGKDVTLLARGDWGKSLREKGLTIRYPLFSRKKRVFLPIVDQLQPDDVYDVIFVVLRFTQLDGILPTLAANPSPRIVFVGNNTRCSSFASQLPGKRVMFAFTMSAGHREPDHVSAIDLKRITIGPLQGEDSSQAFIQDMFRDTPYRVTYEASMGDYLLSHACFVLPAAFACYHTDGDLKKIRGNKAYIHLAISAIVEGYTALEQAGHQILPPTSASFRSRQYRRTCSLFFHLMCATPLGQVCASDHAMHAVEEMAALNDDLKRIFISAGASCPAWTAMEKSAAKYLLPAVITSPG